MKGYDIIMRVRNKSVSKKKQLKRKTRAIDPIKITRPVRTKERKRIASEIKKTNKQLKRLSNYTGKVDSWASKKLSERLTSGDLNYFRNGKIQIPKKPTRFDLYSIKKAIELFKQSKTSTIKGIKEIEKEQIRNIRRRLSDPEDIISKQDARLLYDALDDELFNDIRGSYTPSEMQTIVMRAREEKQSKKDLLEIFNEANDYSNDLDINRKFNTFYNKYIKE